MRKLLLLMIAFALPLSVLAQDQGGNPDAMKEYMKLMSPGAQHALLAEGAGEWNVSHKMWMDPAGEPTVQTGKAKAYMVMDRYLVEDYESTVMGMPFKGQSMTGYDNFRKEYWSTWVDNMSTGISVFRGQWDEATKTLTMNGTMDDPMAGQKDAPIRSTVKHNDDGSRTFEMWGKTPDGKDVKFMEMVYTKAK